MSENGYIEIINAGENNLKNVNLKLPRNNFIVVTGVSGSGKTSLAFDTLYAEGQRRYVESLSSYIRQFMGKIKKPNVEQIKGLPPAIAIEQKTTQSNARSTVGTATEIYDYMRLLFARIGKTYSPISGKEVKKHYVDDVVNFALSLPQQTPILILAPIEFSKEKLSEVLSMLISQGFRRVEINIGSETQTVLLQNLLEDKVLQKSVKSMCLVIDRITIDDNIDTASRIADSVNTAFFEGGGFCRIKANCGDKVVVEEFSNIFEADGIVFEEPSVNMFNFNNPLGACSVCNGFGTTLGFSEDLIIPNKNLSVYDNAVACWRGEVMQNFKKDFINKAAKYNFPIFTPYKDLTNEQKDLLWNGDIANRLIGINEFFKILSYETHKVQNRVMIARFRDKVLCTECGGGRLKKEAYYVKVGGKSIKDLVFMQINDLREFFKGLKLDEKEQKIAKHLLIEINNRIEYLHSVGLGYLTLNRDTNTLSGGEMQRINLSKALGSSLVGSLYILDEPTIGLHPRDTQRLVDVLIKLKEIGNTVVVVEHEQKVIENADWIVDMGPQAGFKGGNIVFEGKIDDLLKSKTLTAQYLNGEKSVIIKNSNRKPSESKGFIVVENACQNNLKNINVKIPLGLLVAITGVSGSGKSTLINDVVYPNLMRNFQIFTENAGKCDSVSITNGNINEILMVDQNPVGKSTRSNCITYLGIYDDIRSILASQPLAMQLGFKPTHFSFNTDGGRCEDCQGEGIIRVDMQFMADVTMICETCGGKRFKDEVLEVKFESKNIYDILEMTVDEAIDFFTNAKTTKNHTSRVLNNIVSKLKVLSKVGLDYVKLGQSTSTLSGGENQRLKLAYFMLNEKSSIHKTLFFFDEPTTGLHFDDVNKLITAFDELVNQGHSIIFIEHNLDMISNADWIIDLGPEGGDSGGYIVFEGTPQDIVKCEKSHTGRYLKEHLSHKIMHQ